MTYLNFWRYGLNQEKYNCWGKNIGFRSVFIYYTFKVSLDLILRAMLANKEAFANEPLVSVIIPIYMVQEYLDQCIESVINQVYRNLEIILVDDGSKDRCPEICDKWAKLDPRVCVIHKEHGGVSSARNVGINIARGGVYSVC